VTAQRKRGSRAEKLKTVNGRCMGGTRKQKKAKVAFFDVINEIKSSNTSERNKENTRFPEPK
jgi:hypothetical protein